MNPKASSFPAIQKGPGKRQQFHQRAKRVSVTGKRQDQSGLALLEVLVGTFVLCVFMVAATPAWRVLDYQLLAARLTERAARVIRQANDFILYAPYDTLPADGGTVTKGWLYQPANGTSGQYQQLLPYTVSAAVTVQNPGTPEEVNRSG